MKRLAESLVASMILCLGMVDAAQSATIAIDFQPPSIATQPICLAKRLDSVISDEWRNWDRKALPARSPDAIMRDARRLRDLSASENFDIVERILALLPTVDPKRKPEDTTVERVDLYLAAGKLKELRELGLVQRLIELQATASPRVKNTLADMYESGSVLAQDEKQSLALRVAAAYGGNAEAMLSLVKINLDGRTVEGWNVEPDLAVIMAFGALVGKLDPAICDRVGRIAREFERGEIVTKDNALAEKWYRFAADLGDGSAAWKVASLHLDGEEIKKDNDVLLKYLKLASNDGVAAAKVELARIFETGSLLPANPKKAVQLYEEASSGGSRSGLVRLALMMERRHETEVQHDDYVSVLTRLTGLPNPPGWAYARLAGLTLDEKGRWAGQDEAIALLEKGVALGDSDATLMLAQLLLSRPEGKGNFIRATELMTGVVDSIGKNEPLAELYGAYVCRSPERHGQAVGRVLA